jgi:hypothetical protein
MKIIAILAILAATPVAAQAHSDQAKSKKQHLKKPTVSVERVWKPVKRVGREGDCLDQPDGYCRSVSDWWYHQMLRN